MRAWTVFAVLIVLGATALPRPRLPDGERGRHEDPEAFSSCSACGTGRTVGTLGGGCAWKRNECPSCHGPVRATASGDLFGHSFDPFPEGARGRR